ncbi:MAG TPA: glycosyltransferase [Candidatus Paceibacterota bacterium]|nr:glycosyltransferase [Candidatus Paceibacterota bacterium]
MRDISSNTKVLFVITKSNWGGAQRYVFDLATALPPEQFDVAVAFGGTGVAGAAPGRLAQMLAEQKIRTIFIPELGRDISTSNDWRAFRALVRIVRHEKPDIVHLNSSKVGGIGALAARLAGIQKILFTSHGLAYDEDRGRFARAGLWLATWATFVLCTRVIVISKDTYRRARALPFCAKKIHLIYNGLEPLKFLSKTEARAALLARMGIHPDKHTFWIGTLGELTKNKGLRYLVGAASLLRKKEIRFVMCIVGEGEERQLLENAIREQSLEDCVHLAGFVPEGHTYLKAFDIYTLTSVKEGLPYVLLEAGQAGVAVVASKIPGNVDIIDENISGLLFESKNKEQLATKLELLIKNGELRNNCAKQLQLKVEAEFTLARMVEKTIAIYIS